MHYEQVHRRSKTGIEAWSGCHSLYSWPAGTNVSFRSRFRSVERGKPSTRLDRFGHRAVPCDGTAYHGLRRGDVDPGLYHVGRYVLGRGIDAGVDPGTSDVTLFCRLPRKSSIRLAVGTAESKVGRRLDLWWRPSEDVPCPITWQ